MRGQFPCSAITLPLSRASRQPPNANRIITVQVLWLSSVRSSLPAPTAHRVQPLCGDPRYQKNLTSKLITYHFYLFTFLRPAALTHDACTAQTLPSCMSTPNRTCSTTQPHSPLPPTFKKTHRPKRTIAPRITLRGKRHAPRLSCHCPVHRTNRKTNRTITATPRAYRVRIIFLCPPPAHHAQTVQATRALIKTAIQLFTITLRHRLLLRSTSLRASVRAYA